MPNPGDRFTVEADTLDGGKNTKDSPSKIATNESPDLLNVVFTDQGSVETRQGTTLFNTQAVGSHVIDGQAAFNGTMVVWAGGDMFRMSNTTGVTIPSAQSQFASGTKIAHTIYQNLLIFSDGTNGPYKYDGTGFYQLGIQVPSAPTAASNAGGDVEAGTYYYRVSFINSQVVEGEAGSASAGITIGGAASITVANIPVGEASHGVDARNVYRASDTAGTYRFVGTISDNATTTFTDSVSAASWLVGAASIDDGTAPTPFTTVKEHKERLFFDDSSERTLIRYTELSNPFLSPVANFEPISKGDKSNITLIDEQDDFVTIFKDNSIWLWDLVDPSDVTTWLKIKSPSNYGIVGPRAATKVENGLLFMGKRNGRITGLHMLTGLNVIETADQKLRTRSVSEKIETDILAFPSTYWPDIEMMTYNNKVYIACAISGDTSNDHMYWFDINRLGSDGQPGSYSLWDGIPVNTLVEFNGGLYAGTSEATGEIFELEDGTYNDRGSAINSYWWSKELGGNTNLQRWIKDWRFLTLWYELVGAWPMNLRYRADGDMSDGDVINVSLTPGGALWDTAVWGTDTWGGGRKDFESDHSLGTLLGRRVQFRVDNQNTADQYFRVHSLQSRGHLRRQR